METETPAAQISGITPEQRAAPWPEVPPPDWRPSAVEYHAEGETWSNSMLKDFRASPALAHARYVARTFAREEPAPQLLIGTAVHAFLLRPDEAPDLVIRVDVESRSAKAYKDAAARAPAAAVVLTKPMWEIANGAARAIREPRTRAAEVARRLLCDFDGFGEYAFRWKDPGTGVPCRTMLDRLALLPSGEPVVPDLKTATDPRPEGFGAAAVNIGYHCQAAFYLRGAQAVLSGLIPRYFWVVVRNEEPFEVYVYQLGEDMFALGDRQIDRDLRALASRLAGEVPWAATEELLADGAVPILRPPAWALRALRVGITTYQDTF